MNTFHLQLYVATKQQRISDIVSFVGVDKNGSFGLQAHHTRFMTILEFGLCRYRLQDNIWYYLALPGGVLYFNNNELSISSRHFLIDNDLERISESLKQQYLSEESILTATRTSLQQMERAMLIQLWKLKRDKGLTL